MTTVAVVDMAHCGTTMLAGVLERLGVPMLAGGDRGVNLEDAAVAHALRKRSWFEALVRERSGRTWGFKHPGAWRYASWFECLESPVYLAIYKDAVSVSRRHVHTMEYIRPDHYVQYTASRILRSLNGIQSSGLPVCYLSYLDAVRDPYAFVVQVVELCGLGVTERQLHEAAKFIKPLGMSYAGNV